MNIAQREVQKTEYRDKTQTKQSAYANVPDVHLSPQLYDLGEQFPTDIELQLDSRNQYRIHKKCCGRYRSD